MIDQFTIDKILEAAHIEDVVGEFVTLKKKGVNFVGLCPFHSDKTPSFYVSPSKNICKCFSCGEGGTAVHFIMKHEQLSYYESLRYLARKYNIDIKEKELTQEQKDAYNERESLFILNDYARTYFTDTLRKTPDGRAIGLSYFIERGFREDMIDKFQLGYNLDHKDNFTQAALTNGYKKEYLIKTGLTIEGDTYLVDRFRGRVIFPIHTLSGKIVAFGGRILKKSSNTGKYINSPESDIYHKSDHLYGIYFAKQAITKADRCYLVEGYTDVISMHQAGIENVVSSSGTALTEGQIRLIRRFTSNITLLYDGDLAGIKATLRGIDLLLEQGLNVKVVPLPNGEDPDSFAKKQNATSLINYLEINQVDFIRFKTQLLLDEVGNDPIQRAALITEIVHSISIIPDTITRSVYIKDCSVLLAMDERVLIEEVNKRKITSLEKKNLKNVATTSDDRVKSHETLTEFKSCKLDKYELAILYYIIRFGSIKIIQRELNENEDSDDMTVLEYIIFDLQRDGLTFQNILYKQILDEAILHSADSSFLPSRYFLAHPDQKISQLTAQLLEDRYELSKVHIKQYGENVKQEDTPLAEQKQLEIAVPRVLTELKNAFISQQIDEIKHQMKLKQQEGDLEGTIELLQQLKSYEDIKKALAKVLGERVVIHW